MPVISADSLPKIFDRLYQITKHFESSRKGLGLGLHICRHLIELHGGRIWVEAKKAKALPSFHVPRQLAKKKQPRVRSLACALDRKPRVELRTRVMNPERERIPKL